MERPSVLVVAGARPNFMKVAPIHRALRERGRVELRLVHTGQHHDPGMSGVFFRDLDLPEPDVNLGVRGGHHARQTAGVLVALDALVAEAPPALVVVVGDVDSTLAASLVAAKRRIPLAHVEAGLRSRDRSMPEEVNRVVADALADLLFAPSPDAVENLRAEGVPPERIHLVGNVMVDSLEWCRERVAKAPLPDAVADLGTAPYAVATLHRPANVDDPVMLARLLGTLGDVAERIPLVLPLHPRTRGRVEDHGLSPGPAGLRITEPAGYVEFMRVLSGARLVLTDSGGVQEEATIWGVPCLTLRDTTERPITVTEGTNTVVGRDPERILAAVDEVLAASGEPTPRRPALWDGHAAERIADVIEGRVQS